MELSQAVAEATAQRTKEKEANAVTVKEAGEAQTAVAQAIEVLKEFYAGAAEATSLAQTDQPAIFDAPYTGMQGESGGVVGMLEFIQSDFGRLEAETSASEQEASKAHKKFINESAVNKARLEKDVEHLNRRKTDREGDLNEATGDLTGAQGEGRGAPEPPQDGPRGGPERGHRGPHWRAGGARRRARVLREAQAELRGRRRDVRG